MTSNAPEAIRAHLARREPIAADVHAVADTAWELLGAGLLDLPLPGSGTTLERWLALAEVAAADLAVARLVEGHLEAQSVFADAPRPMPDGLWGVWSYSGLDWTVTAMAEGAQWVLSGAQPRCPGARSVTGALVTARSDDGVRLFRVPVRHDGVRFEPDSGPPVGMALSDTLTMRLDALVLPADAQIGDAGWYPTRHSYWADSVAVAASWYGAAVGMARALQQAVVDATLDDAGIAELGAVDASCAAMEAVLRLGAAAVDGITSHAVRTTAWQVRAAVRQLAGDVLERAATGLGGGVVAHEPAVARRVADLTTALRRHGGAAELRALGAEALDTGRLA